MKKLLIALIAICAMLFAFGMINASAATSGTCGPKLTWTLNGDTLTISGQGAMNNYNSVSKPWYYESSDIRNIVIEDGVTSIGDYAFSYCESLVSITIPDSVTSIGNYAFTGSTNGRVNITNLEAWCNIYFGNATSNPGGSLYLNDNLLSDITIPDSVTNIGNNVFSGCSGLVSITIPDNVTSIGDSAFNRCSSLVSITIPDSVTSIGDSAFSCCRSLVSITIPDSVTHIGSWALQDCSGLVSITIPDSVTGIGVSMFSRCNSLVSITIPDSVSSIDTYAFRECSSLASITIPDGVTSIGQGAFYECSNLKYVSLPDKIEYIKKDAFYNCPNIDSVFYAGNESDWNNITFYDGNENLNNNNTKVVYNAPKRTYKFETNCDNKLDDIIDHAIFTMPTVENDGMIFSGWYDNKALSGNPVTFPYYGEATTLYAAWTDRTGKSFDDAFIAKANQEYTVTTTENGQYVYFEFVPNLSKEYRFYTTGSKDTYGYLYNSNKSQIASNDDSGEGSNFYISYNLTAGQTYYIATKLYSGTGSFTFVVEESVDYRINEITIKDMSGNSLQAIPTGTFLASISFTNVSSSEDTVIILAQYTDAGAFRGLMYIQTEDVPIGATIKLSIPVDNSKGDVAKLKAFCWESFSSMNPMGNSVSFPAE